MKKMTAILSLLLALALSSCNVGDDVETAGTTAAETDVDTTAVTTVETTAETEETTAETTAAETEIDLTAEENLPYRLLDMTFGEIETEFGPLECPYLMYGGSPVYESEKLGDIALFYASGDVTQPDGRPAPSEDRKPDGVYVYDTEFTVPPGIKKGMTGDDIKKMGMKWEMCGYNPIGADGLLLHTYFSYLDYSVRAGWILPEDYDDGVDYSADPDTVYEQVKEAEERLLNEIQGEIAQLYVVKPKVNSAETEELTIEKALEEYTVYESSFAEGDRRIPEYELLFEEMYDKNENGEEVPEYYAVRFAENRDLAIVVHNMFEKDSVYITRVFYDGKWSECEIEMFFQMHIDINDMGDFIHIGTSNSSYPTDSIFVFDGKTVEHKESDDAIYYFYVKDGELTFYKLAKKFFTQSLPKFGLCDSDDDFYSAGGYVYLKDGELIIEETSSLTVSEYYMSDGAKEHREYYGCETWEEFKEKYLLD